MEESTLTALVDGEFVLEAHDSDFQRGRIGLWTWGGFGGLFRSGDGEVVVSRTS